MHKALFFVIFASLTLLSTPAVWASAGEDCILKGVQAVRIPHPNFRALAHRYFDIAQIAKNALRAVKRRSNASSSELAFAKKVVLKVILRDVVSMLTKYKDATPIFVSEWVRDGRTMVLFNLPLDGENHQTIITFSSVARCTFVDVTAGGINLSTLARNAVKETQ